MRFDKAALHKVDKVEKCFTMVSWIIGFAVVAIPTAVIVLLYMIVLHFMK